MSPLSVVGVHLNKFFNDFFLETPILLSIFKVIFLLLTLFYFTGYRYVFWPCYYTFNRLFRVRTWFGTIEPAGMPLTFNVGQPAVQPNAVPPPLIFEEPELPQLDDSWVTRRGPIKAHARRVRRGERDTSPTSHSQLILFAAIQTHSSSHLSFAAAERNQRRGSTI